MTAVLGGYGRPAPAPRAAALSLIAALHGVGVAALLALGGTQVVTREPEALKVNVIPPVPLKVSLPPPVPLPRMRPPEIRIPEPPEVHVLQMVAAETLISAKPIAPDVPAPRAVIAKPAAAVETPPRGDLAYLENPAPVYPAVSRRAREQGRVMLRVRVGPAGNVEEILLHASSGHARLDDAAINAVRRWRFVPARLGEQAVAGWALVPVNFSLHG